MLGIPERKSRLSDTRGILIDYGREIPFIYNVFIGTSSQ